MAEANRVHPRLGEAKFREYEPYLAEAVRRWPTETQFAIPPGVAASTFIARFRDSLLGLRLNQWPLLLVDAAKWAEVKDQCVLCHSTDGTVWFRSKRQRGRKTKFGGPTNVAILSSTVDAGSLPLSELTDDELRSLALLLNNSRITGPFRLAGDQTARLTPIIDGQLPNCFAHYDPATDLTLLS
jgi:hypothetical protein